MFASRIVVSVTNASRNEAKLVYIELNNQTPCPPRGATWPVIARSDGGSRFTRKRLREIFHSNLSGSLSVIFPEILSRIWSISRLKIDISLYFMRTQAQF
jgi:hypothetical protein